MPATVVTDPARPTRVHAGPAPTVAAARLTAASISAVAAVICSGEGGSERRCRSVIRTHPMSTLTAAVTLAAVTLAAVTLAAAPRTNSVEPPPMSTTRYGGS